MWSNCRPEGMGLPKQKTYRNSRRHDLASHTVSYTNCILVKRCKTVCFGRDVFPMWLISSFFCSQTHVTVFGDSSHPKKPADQVKVSKDGVIEDAKFKTFGCGSAIASSSYVSWRSVGKVGGLVAELSTWSYDCLTHLGRKWRNQLGSKSFGDSWKRMTLFVLSIFLIQYFNFVCHFKWCWGHVT